jgi:hypothetical protein
VEHVTRDDYLNEDTKAKVKEFEKKLGKGLHDSNFIYREKIMSYIDQVRHCCHCARSTTSAHLGLECLGKSSV